MVLTNILIVVAAGMTAVSALDLDISNAESIRNASWIISRGVMNYYTNGEVGPNTQPYQVGMFPFQPYYWWESGAVWGGLVDYQVYTGDKTYENATLTALAAQVGPNYDFVMPQEVGQEGNDDQGFWLFSALSALEYGLPLLPCPGGTVNTANGRCPTHYLSLVDNAFNDYVQRYNNDSSCDNCCNGGLRWQYTPSQKGYDYKNTVSNGAFFQVAARLARYTGNSTYADWANRVFDWTQAVGLMTADYHVYDGAGVEQNCTQPDKNEWSYNVATYMYGAAAMYDYSNSSSMWGMRVAGLVNATASKFFSPYQNATNIMFEQQCETASVCNTDQQSFKAYLSRWMAKTSVLVPTVAGTIWPLLQASAEGAAQSCSGSDNGLTCGTKWYTGKWDGTSGLGQELAALEVIDSLLIGSTPGPRKGF